MMTLRPQLRPKPRTLFFRAKVSHLKLSKNRTVNLSIHYLNDSTASHKKVGMGIGVDIASVDRVTQLIDRYDRKTLSLLFVLDEIDRCQSAKNPYQHFAVCFATKEAVGKALGTGLAGIDWHEIEAVVSDFQLGIRLYGKAKFQAAKLGYTKWIASWSSCDDSVLVHVIAC
jgi:holo-[acyl-carrier protein] synthase